ncbi:DUF6335 family protein [Anthocerotibacter panamensis]|uniref:DUF6335 family protein n=1 Tax=Anthocerotibacter panamensis TaxID=2857077 RepID=UPI001C402AE5|nr:DUF6335 family protein [Anthocerotibacter panamensis]
MSVTDGERVMQRHQYTDTCPELTGGDVDADWQQVGEEAVDRTVSTPDQNTIEELAAAVGLEIADDQELDTFDILEERDTERFELDPESAEDYPDHVRQELEAMEG